MSQEVLQACPLCGQDATYRPVDFGKYKYFLCPKCTLFQISKSAEEKLATAPSSWRDYFSTRASTAPDDHALVIRIPDRHSHPNVPIGEEYVPFAKLPQGSTG